MKNTQKTFDVKVGCQTVKVLASNKKQAEARGILQVLRADRFHSCFFEIEVRAE